MSIVINMIGGKGGGGSGLPNFTYTGTYKVAQDGGKWEIALLTSGTFTASKNFPCDVFMVGGGYGGATSSDAYWGGAGGRGGNLLTKRGLTLTAGAHTVTIGGSGNSSSLDGYTTTDTGYEQGGAGGRRCELDNTGSSGWYVNVSSTSGSVGQKAFNGEDCLSTSDFYGKYFASGGGGGGANYGGATDNGGAGGTDSGGSGGTTDKNGKTNLGGGGGGSYGTQYAAGSGGSGIIIIRGGK